MSGVTKELRSTAERQLTSPTQRTPLSRRAALLLLLLGVLLLGGGYLLIPHLHYSFSPLYVQRRIHRVLRQLFLRSMGEIVGLIIFPAVVLLFPERLWNRVNTKVVLGLCCAFFILFVYHAGRWQFGGYDYSIVIDIGWRMFLGQRPYTDFVASAPPGFDLALGYAFRLLGPSWNSVLALTSVFSCITFLWSYWLYRKLRLGVSASLITAFTMQAASMLTLSFWWYNNSAILLASLLLLSTLALLIEGPVPSLEISVVLAATLVITMKPNFALLAIVGCLGIALAFSKIRLRIASCYALSGLLCLIILLLNHVSPTAMVMAYRGASKERGALSAFGWHAMEQVPQVICIVYMVAFGLAIALLVWTGWPAAKKDSRKALVTFSFLMLAATIAIYGIRTNGEMADLEWTIVLGLLGAVAFLPGQRRPWGQWYVASLMFGLSITFVYEGAVRERIRIVGPKTFYEEEGNKNQIASGFLKGMRVSQIFVSRENAITGAMRANPGPYFFGPRIDFNYAVQGIPSPLHFAAWFHPGTAFARTDLPALMNVWDSNDFQTLIFLRGDYVYYPDTLLDRIRSRYCPDNTYEGLTIWHRQPEGKGLSCSKRVPSS